MQHGLTALAFLILNQVGTLFITEHYSWVTLTLNAKKFKKSH